MVYFQSFIFGLFHTITEVSVEKILDFMLIYSDFPSVYELLF